MLELKTRALLGHLRNMSIDWIEKERPHMKYLVVFRKYRGRTFEIWNEWKKEGLEGPAVLKDLVTLMSSTGKPMNPGLTKLSEGILEILGKYGE